MAAKHAAARGASRLKREGQQHFTGQQQCAACGGALYGARWDEVVPTLDGDGKPGVWVHRACLSAYGDTISAARDERAALLRARIESGELAVSAAALAVARQLRVTHNPRAAQAQKEVA